MPLAAVDGAFLQVTTERIGHHLAHAQRGTGRRIHLVAVMRLDDLDIHRITEYPGRHVEQLQAQVDADTHVRGQHHGDVVRGQGDLCLLVLAETGRADHHAPPCLAAGLEIGQRRLRTGEVDQHIEVIDRGMDIRADRDTEPADTGQLAGVTAQQAAVRVFQRHGHFHALGPVCRLDQATTHASGRAGDCDSGHDACRNLVETRILPQRTQRTQRQMPRPSLRGTQ